MYLCNFYQLSTIEYIRVIQKIRYVDNKMKITSAKTENQSYKILWNSKKITLLITQK